MRHLGYSLSAVLFAGCMASPPSELATGEAAEALKGGGKCMPNVCGTHSKSLFECTYFWELSSDGAANDLGVHIVSVHRADLTAMKLIVEADRLRGVDPVTGAPLADHAQLEGTVIVVMVGSETRTLTIEHVAIADEHFWVGTQSRVEAYDIAYTPPSGGAPLHKRVISYGGQRYDPLSKQITIGPTTAGWMNFACVGGAIYRQHLLGHTQAAQTRLGIPTTLLKRQALLNALTMNACGTGRTWTTDAEPITLTESQLLIPASSPYQVAPATYEAIWTDERAVCVNIPRLATSATMVDQTLEWMANECGAPVPACSGAMLANWQLYGDAVTGNPPGSTP